MITSTYLKTVARHWHCYKSILIWMTYPELLNPEEQQMGKNRGKKTWTHRKSKKERKNWDMLFWHPSIHMIQITATWYTFIYFCMKAFCDILCLCFHERITEKTQCASRNDCHNSLGGDLESFSLQPQQEQKHLETWHTCTTMSTENTALWGKVHV